MKEKAKPGHPRPAVKRRATETWELRLFVAGPTPNCTRAIANLKSLCGKHLADNHRVEIIDLLENPQCCSDEQIVAIPTLVKRGPGAVVRLVGDLSDTASVMEGLGLAV